MQSHRPLPPTAQRGVHCWIVVLWLLAVLACGACMSELLPAATPSPGGWETAPFETATGGPVGGAGGFEAGVQVAPTGEPAVTATLQARATATPGRASATPRPGAQAASPTSAGDGLPAVSLDRLPPEARETVRLIQRGGPFPYRQDGAVFQNRERLLPSKPAGYYREYTVETPGSPDRGARRLVAGSGGELYYTDDHYASFRRVVP